MRQALDAGADLGPARRALAELVERFGRDNVAVELIHELDPLADERYEALAALAEEQRLPVVATTAAHYHGPPRRPLATAMAAVRARSSLDEVDGWLPAWSGQHLRSGVEMARALRPLAGRRRHRRRGWRREIAFPLKLIAPDLPPFPVPPGHTEMSYLRELTYAGAARRFAGKEHEAKAYRMIEHELAIIAELNFPGYFLVVWDIARFCRSRGNPVPGPRLGGQLRGLLRAADHRRRRGLLRPDVRTLPRARARRAAGHRHRHRVRPPGGGRSSTSTSCTAASTPRRSPTSSPTGPSPRSATSPRRSATRRASRTRGARRSSAATTGRPTERQTGGPPPMT